MFVTGQWRNKYNHKIYNIQGNTANQEYQIEKTPAVESASYTMGKGKSVPSQAWSGPEGSRKLRFPDYMTTTQDGGKVVSLTHRPLFTPRKCSWYSFLLEAESTPAP